MSEFITFYSDNVDENYAGKTFQLFRMSYGDPGEGWILNGLASIKGIFSPVTNRLELVGQGRKIGDINLEEFGIVFNVPDLKIDSNGEWEYYTLSYTPNQFVDVTRRFNRLGFNGWEVVSVYKEEKSLENGEEIWSAVLKRRKKENRNAD